jgi:hypothetical protein
MRVSFWIEFNLESPLTRTQLAYLTRTFHGTAQRLVTDKAPGDQPVAKMLSSLDTFAYVENRYGTDDIPSHVLSAQYYGRSNWEEDAPRGGFDGKDSSFAVENANPLGDQHGEAVSSQLELFKSVRRKPTVTEMMTEVVAFCNNAS